jgi:uncharacterized protein YegL
LIVEFLARLIRSSLLQVDRYFDHVALVTFQSSATVQFDLDQYTSEDDLVTTIDELMPSPYGLTNTPSGILEAVRLLNGTDNGARSNSGKVIFLITDGRVSDEFAINYQSAIALLDSTDIFRAAVGIGLTDESVADDLKSFASREQYVQFVGDFSSLSAVDTFAAQAVTVSCNRTTAVTTPGPQLRKR